MHIILARGHTWLSELALPGESSQFTSETHFMLVICFVINKNICVAWSIDNLWHSFKPQDKFSLEHMVMNFLKFLLQVKYIFWGYRYTQCDSQKIFKCKSIEPSQTITDREMDADRDKASSEAGLSKSLWSWVGQGTVQLSVWMRKRKRCHGTLHTCVQEKTRKGDNHQISYELGGRTWHEDIC